MNFRPAGYSDEEDDDDDEFMYGSWSNDDYGSTNNRTDFIPEPISDEDSFYTAINEGNLEILKAMLAKGFNVNEALIGGWSALMHACSIGTFSVVQLLIQAEANVNFNKELFTPLMALCKSTSNKEDELNECLNVLVQSGANINATDRNSCTALMYASSSGHLKLVKTLVGLNCDVNIQDTEGWSALFHAVSECREDIVHVLIENKARVDLIDRRRRSAFDLAMQKGYDHLGELVCSKKEKRKLLQDKEKPSVQDRISSDPMEEFLAQLPNTKGNSQSGFASDVSKLLWPIGLGHFGKQFAANSVQLNEYLLMTDERLKELGVRFSVHRQTILNSIRKFHIRPWNKSSLGMKPRNQQMNIEDGVKLMFHVTKHLHILNATMNYVKIHQPLPISPDVFRMSDSAIHQLSLINGELNAICSFSSQLKQRENVEPVDLIKPKKHSANYTVPLLITTILVSFLLWKRKFS